MNSKKIFFLILLFILTTNNFGQMNMKNLNLMPVPDSIILSEGKYRIDDSFSISINSGNSKRLEKYSNKVLSRLAGRTGFFLQNPVVQFKRNNSNFLIQYNKIGKVTLKEDESYSLKITNNKIELNAKTDIGVIRGLETFLQLISADIDGYYLPIIEITDKPRFPWRGLMLDVARHYMPIDVIKRNLDAMASLKLNVMHWHLTEDQGFRIECKTFPKLHEMGSDGNYYTHEQIKEIVKYANDLGIRVMPEFDIPGHATSWFVGYPEYASAPGPYEIERSWGIFDPTFNPIREETYQFFDKFFAEMVSLFPDEYIHIGGDENEGKHWDANVEIQKYMKENSIKDNHELQSYFNKRILKILTKYNKKMIGWDEIFQPDIPKNIVIHSWRGKESLINAAQQGYQAILSKDFYIDLIKPTTHHYLNDPLPNDIDLTENQKKLILGGEATMWAEFVSPETIDSRIWPRTAAIAERLWSKSSIKNVDDMYRRLDVISFRLEELGIQHIKNQDMLIRRLSNDLDTQPLKIFIDVVEPVKGYERTK